MDSTAELTLVNATLTPPLTLEERGKAYQFTPETARAAARRSIESRAANQPNPLEIRVRTVERLIDLCVKELERSEDPVALQRCATALEKLYKTWALLSGHESPGVKKPVKPMRQRPAVEPIDQ